MMDRVKKAREAMTLRKADCAQSVLTAFSEDFGLKEDTAYSIAQGFGGGMNINSICGAVAGAYMTLGLANPITGDNPRQNMGKVGALKDEFNRRFKELHGSLNCTEILGHDLSKPEEAKKAFEAGVFDTKCPEFVKDAAKIVDSLLKQT